MMVRNDCSHWILSSRAVNSNFDWIYGRKNENEKRRLQTNKKNVTNHTIEHQKCAKTKNFIFLPSNLLITYFRSRINVLFQFWRNTNHVILIYDSNMCFLNNKMCFPRFVLQRCFSKRFQAANSQTSCRRQCS